MHFKTLRKIVILLSFIILATYIALLVYILGEKAYINWLKADINKAWGWGFIVDLYYFMLYLYVCLSVAFYS